MYFLMQLLLVGGSAYLEVIGKLPMYDLIIIIFLSLIVELLVALNRKLDSAEVTKEEEKK